MEQQRALSFSNTCNHPLRPTNPIFFVSSVALSSEGKHLACLEGISLGESPWRTLEFAEASWKRVLAEMRRDCFVIPGSCESAIRCLREKVGKEYWDNMASSMQTSPGIWQREKKVPVDLISAWVWPPIFCSGQQEVGNQGRFRGDGSGSPELACGCRDG